jgi:uncharacterized hydantoinase/oxoprolinase family protein
MPSYSKKVSVPGKTSQELYDKLSAEIEAFLTKISLGDFDCKKDAGKKEIRVKGSLFSATLVCAEGQLVLDAQLSLLATPFKSKIDEYLDKWVKKTFPA